jgi:hypothetical protein
MKRRDIPAARASRASKHRSLASSVSASATYSSSPRLFVEARAGEKGFSNLSVITADITNSTPAGGSTESCRSRCWSTCATERSCDGARPRGSTRGALLRPRLHRPLRGLRLRGSGAGDWMTRHFFSGGQTPSRGLLPYFRRDLYFVGHWALSGLRNAAPVKAVQGEASESTTADSPAISQMATTAGVLLGTAAYMSPEQAKGKPVDRRAGRLGVRRRALRDAQREESFHGRDRAGDAPSHTARGAALVATAETDARSCAHPAAALSGSSHSTPGEDSGSSTSRAAPRKRCATCRPSRSVARGAAPAPSSWVGHLGPWCGFPPTAAPRPRSWACHVTEPPTCFRRSSLTDGLFSAGTFTGPERQRLFRRLPQRRA